MTEVVVIVMPFGIIVSPLPRPLSLHYPPPYIPSSSPAWSSEGRFISDLQVGPRLSQLPKQPHSHIVLSSSVLPADTRMHTQTCIHMHTHTYARGQACPLWEVRAGCKYNKLNKKLTRNLFFHFFFVTSIFFFLPLK